MRLDKRITALGLTRAQAKRLIARGEVRVNGEVERDAGRIVTDADEVRAQGTAAAAAGHTHLLLFKPAGVLTATRDGRETTVLDLIPAPPRGLGPVGRLDKDSSGLLLLTSDGEIVNRILRAAGGHEKEYVVAVDKAITPDFLRDMAQGVEILGRKTLPCRIHQLTVNSFSLVLVQGLNRQIRRMCEALGYRVRGLRRIRVMNIRLGDLPPGSWRELTEEELCELNRLTGRSGRTYTGEARQRKKEPDSADRSGRKRTAGHQAAEGRTSWKSNRGSKNL